MTMVRLLSILGCALALTLFLPLASHPLARSEASWERLGLPGVGVEAIALDTSRPQTLLVVGRTGSEYKVFRSGDGGQTWADLPGFSARVFMLAVAAGRGVYYAGVPGSGIYRSTDALSWTRVYTATQAGEGFRDIRVSRSNPRVAYALTALGFFASGLISTKDGGDVWLPGNRPAGDVGLLDLDIDAQEENRVYVAGAYGNFGAQWVSEDGGFRWVGDGIGGPGYAVAVRADAALSETYYVAVNCLYRVRKGVVTSISPGLDCRSAIDNRGHFGLASSAAVPGDLFAAVSQNRVDWSVDRGDHWATLGAPNPNLYITTLEVDEENPQNLYLGTTDGLWRARLPRYYFPALSRQWAGGW